MINDDDDESDEPDLGRLVGEHWPELRDPREDVYTQEDGLPILDARDFSVPDAAPSRTGDGAHRSNDPPLTHTSTNDLANVFEDDDLERD